MSRLTLLVCFALAFLSTTRAQGGSYIRGVQSTKCMTIHYASNDNGAGIEIYECVLGGKNQFWTLYNTDQHGTPLPSGTTNLVVDSSGKCLTVLNARTDQGAPLIQWDCVPGGQGNQLWQITPDSAGYYQIRNTASNRCVTVLNAATGNYSPLILWDCVDGPNQQWYSYAPCV